MRTSISRNLLALFLALLALGAVAQDSGETVSSIDAEESFEPVAFLADREVIMAGSVGDFFGAGQTVTVTGEVEDNFFACAQSIELDEGCVGGDILAFSQSLDIEGFVEGDVYFGGEILTLGPDAEILGNLYIACRSLILEGRLQGRIYGSMEKVVISGEIGGGEFHCVSLRLGSEARIRGDLRYLSNFEAEMAEGALVLGTLEKVARPSVVRVESEDEDDDDSSLGAVFGWIWRLLSLWIIGLVLLWLGRPLLRAAADSIGRRPGPALGWGVLALIALPIVAVVAMVLIIGIPLGILTMVLYGALLYLAALPVALWAGDKLLRMMGVKCKRGIMALSLGLVLFFLIILIPGLGLLTRIVVLVFGLGAWFLGCREVRAR